MKREGEGRREEKERNDRKGRKNYYRVIFKKTCLKNKGRRDGY